MHESDTAGVTDEHKFSPNSNLEETLRMCL